MDVEDESCGIIKIMVFKFVNNSLYCAEEHLLLIRRMAKIMVIRCRHNHFFFPAFPDFGDFISTATKKKKRKKKKKNKRKIIVACVRTFKFDGLKVKLR